MDKLCKGKHSMSFLEKPCLMGWLTSMAVSATQRRKDFAGLRETFPGIKINQVDITSDNLVEEKFLRVRRFITRNGTLSSIS